MVKVSEVRSAHEFWEVLEKSELLNATDMESLRAKSGDDAEPIAIARYLVGKGHLTKWQAGQVLAGRHSLRIGKYKLNEQIGKGELGRVYLAEHLQMGRKVALKALSRQFTRQTDIVERFLAEAREVAALDHRNIIHVYDIDEQDDRFYLVMEYVEGRDVQRMVNEQGVLPCVTAAEILRQAASGLGYLHQCGMLHRDVKPANLIVDSQDIVKLLGLGVGQLADFDGGNGQSATKASAMNAFHSPEQRERKSMDRRSDLHSLGGTFYYMLTGNPPPADAQPADPSQVRDETPKILAELCQRMMACRPEDRCQSAEDVIETLNEWIDGQQPTNSAGDSAAAFDWSPGEAPSSSGSGPTVQSPSALTQSGPRPVVGKERRKLESLPLGVLLGGAALSGAAFVGLIVLVWNLFTGAGTTEPTPALAHETPSNQSAPDDQPELAVTESVAVDDRTSSDDPLKPADGEEPVQPTVARGQAVIPRPTDGTTTAVPNAAKPAVPPESGPTDTKPAAEERPNDLGDLVTMPPGDAKPKPEKKPPDPLRSLTDRFELPDIESSVSDEWASLGTLHLEPADLCFVNLEGGASAVRGKTAFTLRNANNGTAEREWEIFLDGGRQPAKRAVARMAMHDDQLQFQWTDAARDDSVAGNLCNCILRFNVGPATRSVMMRSPVSVDPLVVGLDRPISAKWPMEFPPDPDSVRIEITRFEGEFPPHEFEAPGEQFSADGGVAWVHFGKDERLLSFQIESSFRRLYELTVQPHFTLVAGVEPTRMNQSNLKKVVSVAQIGQQTAFGTVQQLRGMLDQAKKKRATRPEIQRLEQQLRLAEQRMSETALINERLDMLHELREKLNGVGLIHFRVWAAIDEHEVVLLTTD